LNEITNPGRNVYDVRLTPDGTRAVFVADQDTDNVAELYSVPIDGSTTPVQLSPDPIPGGHVSLTYAISPDSSRVVFVGDFEIDETLELWSARIEGGTPAAKLSGPMVAGGDVGTFTSTDDLRITADSRSVVYLADQETDGTVELFQVGVAGARPAVKLNAQLTPFADVHDFRLGPGGRVAYLANQDDLSTPELYGVPARGQGQVEKLNGPMQGGVQAFEFSSRGRVVYRADQEAVSVFELFSSRAEAGALRADRPAGP
jgi:dipeptidyl aminopeptidase/acylaminoacyl peptidase